VHAGKPLLVIDHIDVDLDRVSAELWIGDQRERIELGLSMPGLVAFDHMPAALAAEAPARDAIVDRLLRAHAGEALPLPVDLSDVVRQASEPWPLPAHAGQLSPALEAAAAASPAAVTRIERNAPQAGLTTVHLEVAGESAVVVVDLRGGPEQVARFRFAKGVHPWQLAAAPAHGMLVALLAAARAA
jgi:hypothetical protein